MLRQSKVDFFSLFARLSNVNEGKRGSRMNTENKNAKEVNIAFHHLH